MVTFIVWIAWIIILSIILWSVRKKGQGNKNFNSSSFTYGRTMRDIGTYAAGTNQYNTGTNQYHTGVNQSGTGNYQRTQNVSGISGGNSLETKKKSDSVVTDISEKAQKKETKETSTLAYLNEKAEQDQREHAIEKMEERKRVSEKYGNRPVGGRYLLGDPIPQGMKIVCCEYCGAENVVKIGYRGDRDCYFCRTRLED